MKMIDNDLGLALFYKLILYNWNVYNKLKASIPINAVNLFYYRLVTFIYNALDESDYFNEEYF
ncbi:hypothetical protein MaMVDC_135 [uncultured phage]|nr:hypothetical protein MaMVDC_135 [uncultured phage]